MFGHRALALVCITIGCGGTTPSAETPAATPSASASPPVATAAVAPEPAPTPAPEPVASSEPPHERASADAELVARATGPAKGGPRGVRPCAFHESVDSYQRQCESKVNADGSLSVVAKGTALNPEHGFNFTLHGGDDNVWVAQGNLNAFKECTGPFVARVSMSVDKGVKTYELRFKEHCMIVVR